MIGKKHIKHILRSIRNAFDISETLDEYEKLCECIYFSDCCFDYVTFSKLKNLVC